MKRVIVVILLLMVNSAFAVEISQVLFNPSDESHGEAVELFNPSSETINISGWYLETERSSKDATIQKNTFLELNSKFLITDIGWNLSKDDPSWRNSDYEEAITLKNENSFVNLRNSLGELISSYNWSTKQPFVAFFDENAIPIELIVEREEFFILDESEKEGIQVKGNTKQLPIKIYRETQPKVEFLEDIFFMNEEGNNYYNLTLNLENLQSGNYSVKIEDEQVNFEYLRFENYEILTKNLVVKNKSSLEIKNTGNTQLKLTLTANLPVPAELKTNKIELSVGEQKTFNIEFNTEGINPGKYEGVLIIE